MNTSTQTPELNHIQKRSLTLGLLALALCIGGAYFSPHQFFRSYLIGYLFWIGIALGCFAIVMLHHLVGGPWGFVIRRFLESGIRTLPLMALLFVPLIVGMKDLYIWARPETGVTAEILGAKSLYLNGPFFVMRTVMYFAIWIGVGYFLNRWSLEQDRTGDAFLTRRLQFLSGPGLVLYGLTVTFSAIDWVMSLEPRWFSTIYGLLFMVAYGLAALAFTIVVVFLLSSREPLSHVILPAHFHDLGNLLLAFVMLWAYMAFSQFLIVYAENLTEEIPWYLRRTEGGWQWVALSLIIFQFALPFLLLLSRATKRRAKMLAMVAVAIVAMHLVNIFWLVAPAFSPPGLRIHWMDLVTPIGIGGLWIAVFLHHLKKCPVLPLHDPRFEGLLEHAHEAEA